MQFYLPLKINLLHPKQAVNLFVLEKDSQLFILLIASIYDFNREEKKESKTKRGERAISSYLSIDSRMKIVSIIKINLSLVHASEFSAFFLCFQCRNLHQKYSANEISNFLVRCAPFNRLLIVFH